MPRREKCHRCDGTGFEHEWFAIGASMRKRREQLGIGLRELCRLVGLTPAYLSDMERGRRAWRGAKARAVADYLERAR